MQCNKDKVTYKSQNEAKAVIVGMNNAKFEDSEQIETPEDIAKHRNRQKTRKRLSNKKKASMKAYFCKDCNGWHLMTQNKKKIKPYRGNTGVKNVLAVKKRGKIIIKDTHNFKIS